MTTAPSTDERLIRARSRKLLLLFAMVGMGMMFAGLTSAFVVSKNRADWLKNVEMPSAFYWSTAVMLLSSVTFWLALRHTKNQNASAGRLWLLVTLGLGCTFVGLQYVGFDQLVQQGFYFTGPQSNIATTFMYTLVAVHLAHLLSGLVVLLVVIYNHFKQKYSTGQTTGIELGAMYWHFLDFLWLYLFLFLYFFR